MLFGRYSFRAVFQEEAVLPEYKGSTFRGVFGHALKTVVCALKLRTCEDCLLQARCLYPAVFEGPRKDEIPPEARRPPDPPRPYVIAPPLETKERYQPGDPFAFTLILFGPINENYAYFIYAMEQMGMMGIGRRVNGRAASYVLENVETAGRLVYEKKGRVLHKGPFTTDIPAASLIAEGPFPEQEQLGIRLLTPLRLKYQNRLTPELPFHVLIRAALRRAATLYEVYDGGEPPLDYGGLVHRAQKVRLVSSQTRWLDWRRYSNRQERDMFMGGIIGEAIYEGPIGEFMPLLRFAEIAHLGKSTTFGLGRIELFNPAKEAP
ncbi:MAG: CRISPR system precrRNA processing endoribonuclease RAMP protein Cas6 [Syntrophales bacterium]|nr:CRISPR system precrRNA processing endoribonuclease RAMP protein Cas6 [Syntrophales bacterium]